MLQAGSPSLRRVATAAVALLIAALSAVTVRALAADPSLPLPGPNDPGQAAADGAAAGPQRSNVVGSPLAGAGPGVATPAAAPGAGATAPGFVSFHVYATQYAPNTQGSSEVAVPDRCVKFAALQLSGPFGNAGCSAGGYPSSGDYRVFVSSDDTGKNAYI